MQSRNGLPRLRLAVLMGGQSAERDVSLHSGQTVLRELKHRHRLKRIEILPDGKWRLAPGGRGVHALEALRRLRRDGVEAVFNALHGPLGEDGSVQGLFRMLEMPLTGPDIIPAAVTMDKRLTKLALLAAGMKTPRFFSLSPEDFPRTPKAWDSLADREAPRIPFPWVLKPNRLGSSVGVAIIQSAGELARQAPGILASWPGTSGGDDLLVEEAISGRELTCGVLEADGRAEALPPIEIRPRARAFFDYHAKYTPGATEEICPAPISASEREAIESAALEAHSIFRCAPLSRTDMFLTAAGEIQVLEVNTLPGLTATSLIPLALERKGLPLRALFEALIAHAIHRAQAQGYGPGAGVATKREAPPQARAIRQARKRDAAMGQL